MSVTWYNTTGQPSDSIGNDGDWARDATNKVDYGPRGSVTAGSWANTKQTLVGATGAPLLSFNGTPGSSYGQNGQGAIDLTTGNTFLKSSNAWSQSGQIVGATGAAGPSMLYSLCAANGTMAYFASTGTVAASTATNFVFAGSTTNYFFQPPSASAFMGFSVQGGSGQTTATITFTLYDLTANSPVYSQAVTYTSSGYLYYTSGVFSVSQYPLQAGHQYTWQFSSSVALSGGIGFYITPIYAQPSTSTGPCVSPAYPMGFATASSITTTYNTLPIYGTANNAYIYPARNGGQYAIQFQMTAQGSTPTTATASLTGLYYPNAGGSTGTFTGFPITVTADGVMRTIFMAAGGNDGAFTPAYRFFYQIKSASTISVTCLMQLFQVV